MSILKGSEGERREGSLSLVHRLWNCSISSAQSSTLQPQRSSSLSCSPSASFSTVSYLHAPPSIPTSLTTKAPSGTTVSVPSVTRSVTPSVTRSSTSINPLKLRRIISPLTKLAFSLVPPVRCKLSVLTVVEIRDSQMKLRNT